MVVEIVGGLVLFFVVTVLNLVLIKRIDEMSRKLDIAVEWVSIAKEKHGAIHEKLLILDTSLISHEERIHILEKFSDRVKIYHKQNHSQDL